MRGTISIEGLPVKSEAIQSLKRFADIYDKFRQKNKAPLLQRGHTLFLQGRTLRLEPQYVYRKGEDISEDNAFLVVGCPQKLRLSQQAFAPDISDRQTNTNLVGSLRKKVKGAIFDGEIKGYPFLVFLPSTFFLFKVNYESASPHPNEFCWYSSERWAFPGLIFSPGINRLMIPGAEAAKYPGVPFYTPTLEEWGGVGDSADTFAQQLKAIFVPLRDGKYKSGGEIVMLSFLCMAYPYYFHSFEEYLTSVKEKMGLDLLGYLNYAK